MRNAKFIFSLICAAAIATLFVDERADESTVVRAAKATQTFSLVHAIGNKERVSARGLSESECKKRKEYLAVSAAMVGGGSVTCLPDSLL